MQPIDLFEKFGLFDDHWSPKVIAELNGQAVKIAKVSGRFVWHDHAGEDELFMVLKGKLFLDLRDDQTVTLREGQLYVVPRGVEHLPYTDPGKEAWIILIEPIATKHTGEVEHELTVKGYERI